MISETKFRTGIALALTIMVALSGVGLGSAFVPNETAETTTTDATIASELSNASGQTEVIVRFEAADQSTVQATGSAGLKTHAEASQVDLEQLADSEPGLTIDRQFWIANAALVEVDTDSVDLKSIAAVDGVTAIHQNMQIEVPDTEQVDKHRVSSADTAATPGLDQIDAPTAWEQFDTQGENVSVAVLDTGIDVSHPDLNLTTTNESDPTYPGGWAEFNGTGDEVEGSQPYDSEGHGTHVSGTVAGGNESGTHVGVAPKADLMHGLVLPQGSGSFAQIISGMEWAVTNSADVMVMSLGTSTTSEQLIEPVRNANSAGVATVAASGNDGAGTSGSPANVYESIAVGAVDNTGTVAPFSSGEEIDTDVDWNNPPNAWPDSYVVPDVTAPGVSIKSTLAGGGYGTASGTSMATPHVGGIYALALATDDDRSIDEIRTALEETAQHPDGDVVDNRYGNGIVSAQSTLAALGNESINGTVTDSTGDPVSNATISLDTGIETTTDSNGLYDIPVANGTYTVSVEMFGYESESQTITVDDNETVTTDFSLTPELAGKVVADQPEEIEAGDTITTELDVAHVETITVDTATQGALGGNETLTVNGQEYSIGTEIPTSIERGTVTVTLETTTETADSVSLEHTIGLGPDEKTITTGPTMVFEEFTEVAVVDDSNSPHSVATAVALDDSLNGSELSIVESDVVTAGGPPPHDVYVVHSLSDENATEFISATDTPTVGVVYLDQWGSDADGIPTYGSVTSDPAETKEDDGFNNPTVKPPVNYTVESTHPILNNASVGESIPIHNGPYADHTWFNDTSFEVLASVTHGATNESVGPALAVDNDSNTVLASSLGRTYFVQNKDYTDEADEILAESTAYVTPGDIPVVQVSSIESFAGYNGTATVNTSADGVAGYQTAIEYDPDVVHVTAVDGGDIADPVVNIDNENGSVAMAQTDLNTSDEPILAEVDFKFVGERADETTLTVNRSETSLSNENANTISTNVRNGFASTLACYPGDVSRDDEVTINDATQTQRYIVNEPISGTFDANCGDLNRDGQVTSGDVTLILKKIVGLSNSSALAGE